MPIWLINQAKTWWYQESGIDCSILRYMVPPMWCPHIERLLSTTTLFFLDFVAVDAPVMKIAFLAEPFFYIFKDGFCRMVSVVKYIHLHLYHVVHSMCAFATTTCELQFSKCGDLAFKLSFSLADRRASIAAWVQTRAEIITAHVTRGACFVLKKSPLVQLVKL